MDKREINERYSKIGMELNISNQKDIKELISECLHHEEFRQGREQAKRETWMHMGEGARRTVDYITDRLRFE